jgi:hypothetical protein
MAPDGSPESDRRFLATLRISGKKKKKKKNMKMKEKDKQKGKKKELSTAIPDYIVTRCTISLIIPEPPTAPTQSSMLIAEFSVYRRSGYIH